MNTSPEPQPGPWPKRFVAAGVVAAAILVFALLKKFVDEDNRLAWTIGIAVLYTIVGWSYGVNLRSRWLGTIVLFFLGFTVAAAVTHSSEEGAWNKTVKEALMVSGAELLVAIVLAQLAKSKKVMDLLES